MKKLPYNIPQSDNTSARQPSFNEIEGAKEYSPPTGVSSIKKEQKYLKDLGYYKDKIDGIRGKNTISAEHQLRNSKTTLSNLNSQTSKDYLSVLNNFPYLRERNSTSQAEDFKSAKEARRLDGILGKLGVEDDGTSIEDRINNFQSSTKDSQWNIPGVPTNVYSLGADVLGSKSNLTNSSFDENQLEELKRIVSRSLGRGRKGIQYSDYDTDAIPSATGRLPSSKGNLSTVDKAYDPAYNLKTTIGRANISVTPGGKVVVTDKYDFNNGRKSGNIIKDTKNLASDIYSNPNVYSAFRAVGREFGSKEGQGRQVLLDLGNIKDLPEYKKNANTTPSNMRKNKFAYGGSVKRDVPVEIEGKELLQTPQGQVFQPNGPTHENGGIDVNLPEGTEVYSNRVKVDGVSMSNRKKKRVKKEMKLEDLMKLNKSDKILKGSLDRTKEVNQIEDSRDLEIQGFANQLMGGAKPQKFALGTSGNGISPEGMLEPFQKDMNMNYDLNPFVSSNVGSDPQSFMKQAAGFGEKAQSFGKDALSGLADNAGDIIGMISNVTQGRDLKNNTIAAQQATQPNINMFENFGQRGLQSLEDSKQALAGTRDQNLQNLESQRVGATQRSRNSSRGVNTMRATDIANTNVANKQQNSIYTNYNQNIASIFGQQANLQNQQDQVVMGGEQARDLADRKDTDNFYSNMSQNINAKHQGLQNTSKDLNAIKGSEVSMNLINQLSKYGLKYDRKGNLIKIK